MGRREELLRREAVIALGTIANSLREAGATGALRPLRQARDALEAIGQPRPRPVGAVVRPGPWRIGPAVPPKGPDPLTVAGQGRDRCAGEQSLGCRVPHPGQRPGRYRSLPDAGIPVPGIRVDPDGPLT